MGEWLNPQQSARGGVLCGGGCGFVVVVSSVPLVTVVVVWECEVGLGRMGGWRVKLSDSGALLRRELKSILEVGVA